MAPNDEKEKPSHAKVVDRNIKALLKKQREEENDKNLIVKFSNTIAKWGGSIYSLYFHSLFFGGWIFLNLGITSIEPFDSSFQVLAMIASVESIFLSTFVLITQNRMAKLADKRTDLDLHISLLSEHEITKVLNLVSAIAKKMEIEASDDPELSELARDVNPEKLLNTLIEKEKESFNIHRKN